MPFTKLAFDHFHFESRNNHTIICCIGKYGCEDGKMINHFNMCTALVLKTCKALEKIVVMGSAQQVACLIAAFESIHSCKRGETPSRLHICY